MIFNSEHKVVIESLRPHERRAFNLFLDSEAIRHQVDIVQARELKEVVKAGLKPEVIYIAGKYRASTKEEIELNIAHARAASIRLSKEGWVVFCPHTNWAHFDGHCPDSFWLHCGLVMLGRCDAIYLLTNWHDSEGAIGELRKAQKLGLEVYYE